MGCQVSAVLARASAAAELQALSAVDLAGRVCTEQNPIGSAILTSTLYCSSSHLLFVFWARTRLHSRLEACVPQASLFSCGIKSGTMGWLAVA